MHNSVKSVLELLIAYILFDETRQNQRGIEPVTLFARAFV
jgi:hypothetical protein